MVVVENVLDFVLKWDLFDWWRSGFHALGYTSEILSVSSAHIGDQVGNDPAAQWRNRVYIRFLRQGITAPKLAPRPLAWCAGCGVDVAAVQTWNVGRTVGAYREQYWYRCPNSACRHQLVEPYVAPAASVIDWSDLGQRLGDRARPLAASTMRKIRHGLATYADEPSLVTVNHGSGSTGRVVAVRSAPMPTRTGKIGEGLITPSSVPVGAFIAELRGGGSLHRSVTHPLATVAASGNHHGLVIPYRNKCHAYPTTRPLHTLSTIESAALVHPGRSGEWSEADEAECRFRMLNPREQLSAQRFRGDYVVHGNVGEQTMQAGNAVSVNVARWIGEQTMTALGGAA